MKRLSALRWSGWCCLRRAKLVDQTTLMAQLSKMTERGRRISSTTFAFVRGLKKFCSRRK